VKLGLHVNSFNWDHRAQTMAVGLANVATAAEDAGFSRLSVGDHVWQTSQHGLETDPMLEAYTTLGYLAGRTHVVELLTLVSCVTYRSPGLLAKSVTTLDVLSEGRAMLGIGAGWNEEEAIGLGLDFAGINERFERLEETLQICLQMWSGDAQSYRGQHYTLSSTVNSPASISRPRPRILIGGAGERRTLRLVARYADACNIFGGPDAEHKLRVLREHCDREGRDYDSIEKTAIVQLDPESDGGVSGLLTRLENLGKAGFDSVSGSVPDVETLRGLEVLGNKVIPEISTW
jgi:F420-dependent oxidoreductase-like protein